MATPFCCTCSTTGDETDTIVIKVESPVVVLADETNGDSQQGSPRGDGETPRSTNTAQLYRISTGIEMSSVPSCSSLVGDDSMRQTTMEKLQQVADLVDKEYDILPAEALLAEIQILIGHGQFMRDVVTSDLFERFCRKAARFYEVGKALSQSQEGWMEVFNGEGGRQTIRGLISPEDASVVHYIVRAEIPTNLTSVMAVANEIQLMNKWNSLVVNTPKTIGDRTAHRLLLNYQISALGGMYKVDVLNEIRRFSDPNAGYIVEYINSLPEDHPTYTKPEKGFKRVQTLLQNVVLACGPTHCLLIQVGRLKLPFNCPMWLAKAFGQLGGKFMVGGLVQNAVKAAAPGSPWETLIKDDSFGLYARLQQCVESEESKRRDPGSSKDARIGNIDLSQLFVGRHFYEERKRTSLSAAELRSPTRRQPKGQCSAEPFSPVFLDA